tara:strand:- start:306 stop:431 length:126 start_codon:yes stop_codon:yes gene_type:complete
MLREHNMDFESVVETVGLIIVIAFIFVAIGGFFMAILGGFV